MSFVLNPDTNRMVKVGGKKWRELVKKGMVDNMAIQRVDENQLQEVLDNNQANASDKILKKKPKIGMKTSRTRGGKTSEWTAAPHQEDMADYTAKAASRTLHKHMETLSEQLHDAYENDSDEELGDFEFKLKNLILQEMVSPNIHEKPNKKMMIGRIKQKPLVSETDYELEEQSEEESEEE
jgi:hypothetical protein